MPLVARLLGESTRSLSKKLPVIDKGYRNKGVTIAALRTHLDEIETPPTKAPRTLRIIQPTSTNIQP